MVATWQRSGHILVATVAVTSHSCAESNRSPSLSAIDHSSVGGYDFGRIHPVYTQGNLASHRETCD